MDIAQGAYFIHTFHSEMWLGTGLISVIMQPLSRIATPLHEFRVRSRIFRGQGQLRETENRVDGAAASCGLIEALDSLAHLKLKNRPGVEQEP